MLDRRSTLPADVADAELADDLELITNAAAEAGALALRYFKKDPDVWLKDGHSPVSEADLAVDNYLRSALLDARPDYGWLSEETVDDRSRLACKRVFVVDPIDGTRAYLEGRDIWCVSIAIVEDGRTVCGVLDCPALDERFTALAGEGAYRDGTRLAVSEAGETGRSLRIGGPKPFLRQLDPAIAARNRSTPYIPSLAYRIAMVADRRLDATFIRPSCNDWDIAASVLLLQEAGGALLDPAGATPRLAEADPCHGALLATTKWLGPDLLPVLGVPDRAKLPQSWGRG